MFPDPTSGAPRWRTLVLAAILFWTFIAVLYGLQIWWLSNIGGETLNLRRVLVWQGAFYLGWIPFTLLIWRATRSWLPDTLGWPKFLLYHALFAPVVAALHTTLVTVVGMSIHPENVPFRQVLVGQFRGRMHMQVLIYTAVFAAGQAVALYWRYRERQMAALRLEGQLTSARLEALQAHLQPHFLFNSLHSIASLARTGDNAGVIRLTADLSELLRSSLDSNGKRHQALREEIQLVEKYLAIQRVRFQDRLSHTVDIEPEAAAALVPLFVVQPLVENALRHGVGPRIGPGRIHVRAFRDGTLTAIDVEDDGVGLPSGWSLDDGNGTGLRNLAARLQAEFGPAHVLTIANRPEGGVIASVRLPPIAS
jgi:signal transduction histidine kinase